MTNKERINATLRCEPTDRPPVIDWLGLAAWEQTLERWRRESGLADLDLKRYFAYDEGHLIAPLELGPWPHYQHTVLHQDDEHITYVDYRGITIRDRKDYGSLPDFVAGPVRTRDDWLRYKEERLQRCLEARTAKVPAFVERAAAMDAPVQVGVFPYGCFGTARDVLGVENLLVAFYDDPAMVRDIIETHTDLWLALYGEVARRIRIDHIHIWEDMCGRQGSLISMAMVREFMMPSYDRIAAFGREHGVAAFSVDSDGNVDELVPQILEHDVQSFFPFEVQAGSDIVRHRRRFPGMSVWGGLDKRALAADRSAIHHELDRATELFALGGYIVGFDHAIPPDVPWESFAYFMRELDRITGRR